MFKSVPNQATSPRPAQQQATARGGLWAAIVLEQVDMVPGLVNFSLSV